MACWVCSCSAGAKTFCAVAVKVLPLILQNLKLLIFQNFADAVLSDASKFIIILLAAVASEASCWCAAKWPKPYFISAAVSGVVAIQKV